MKRKVQAQRKFAQGAPLPNSTNIVSVQCQQNSSQDLSEPGNKVVPNTTSVKNLLDIVCFQNLHPHLQPVVVVERLKTTPVSNTIVMPKRKSDATGKDENIPVKKPMVTNKLNMQLRSQTRKLQGKIAKNQNFGDKKTNLQPNNPDFVLVDNRPSTCFTKKTASRKRKTTTGVKANGKSKPQLPPPPPSQPPTPPPPSQPPTPPPPPPEESAVSISSDDKPPEKKGKSSPVPGRETEAESSQLCGALYYSPDQSNIKLDRDATDKLPTHYSFNEIDRWAHKSLQENKTTSENAANQINTKPSTSGTNSHCPSELLSTVTKTITTHQSCMDQHCKACQSCHNVEKVLKIEDVHSAVDDTNSVQESDVNEFRAENDGENSNSNEHSQNYTSKRKERTNQTSLDPNIDKGEKIYIELSKESATVIEVRVQKNQIKSLVNNIKIVPKTPDMELTELDINQNEKILDAVHNSITNLLSAKNKQNKETTSAMQENQQRPCFNNTQPTSSKTFKTTQVDAPVFYPNETEFKDPIEYFNKIMPVAAKFGMCKIVAPPEFKPKCTLNDDVRFGVTNQYISRLYARWGPASREMSAIKAYLASQSVVFTRPPLLEGIEVNLPRLYHLVQRFGGLKNVIEKKRWSRIADEMRITQTPNTEQKLDQIYVKYILPYDTLSSKERHDILKAVEVHWNKKNLRMLDRAMNPLHRQKRVLGESESSEDENDEVPNNVLNALIEAEDCVVPGRQMNLATFKKVSTKAVETFFNTTTQLSPSEVEVAYWKCVLLGTDHVCVNTASIDTGEEGYGFTTCICDPYKKHPWNLKTLSQNEGNILRSLGPILGATVPTLHLGMVYSTSCWHRDPHGLPWIEYMHSGPGKIWYGIPDEQSSNFRRAVESLSPTSCQNKSIWLPSDITMIPPKLLLEHNVSISRVVQKPGEFIIVFPKAYSSSICTGYTESESAYFATTSWLKSINQVFHEVRESCEPTMFSLEQLLIAVARDPRTSLAVLQPVYASLRTIIDEEIKNRSDILKLKVQSTHGKQSNKRPAGAWNIREQDECYVCRATLYLSRVRGLTDKKSSVCLTHALRLLEIKPERANVSPAVEMEVFFSETELETIMLDLENRLLV